LEVYSDLDGMIY